MTFFEKQSLLHRAYRAFNSRDIDEALSLMQQQVKWPRAWEGDHVRGHAAVRSYWEQQWKTVNPTVTPIRFQETPNGAVEVTVEQLVKDMSGTVLFDGKVKHIYTMSDGLIDQMDVQNAL